MLEIPHKYQWRFPASRFRFPISLAPRTVMFIYPIFPLIYEKPSRFTEPENLTSFVVYPLMNLTTGSLLPIKWAKCFSRRVRVEKYPHCKALLRRSLGPYALIAFRPVKWIQAKWITTSPILPHFTHTWASSNNFMLSCLVITVYDAFFIN